MVSAMPLYASFDHFPAEVTLEILYQLSDLETLDSIVRASPNAWRVFSQYGVDIMERVLDSGYIHKHSRVMTSSDESPLRLSCTPLQNTTLLEMRSSHRHSQQLRRVK